LTRQEKQWNEREKKDIEQIHQRNLKIIQEFKNGEKLREWELKNFDEDFQLQWDEKRELHALESQQRFFQQPPHASCTRGRGQSTRDHG